MDKKKTVKRNSQQKDTKKTKCNKGTKAFMDMHEIIKTNNIEMINTFKQIKYYL